MTESWPSALRVTTFPGLAYRKQQQSAGMLVNITKLPRTEGFKSLPMAPGRASAEIRLCSNAARS